MKTKENWTPMAPCKHNTGVTCDKADKCEKCGWNPAVEKRRKERMAKAYALQRRSS